MQFPVMTVTNEGKNLMSEAVQSGNKIKFEEVVISSKYVSDASTIEDMEALTYDWFTTGVTTTIRGNVSKVTLQTDDVGKSFINISGEIFPNGTLASPLNAYTLAITARIGDGPLKLFGISKTLGTKTILTFGTSGTTKINVSANISTASVGGDIIAYTFDSNYVTGDDFDMFSQTLRSDIEVAKRYDLANRHYYNNPIDAIRYSSPMNSFKLRSGLYPELSVDMKGDSTQQNLPLSFIRLEHERYSLVLGMASHLGTGEDPQICVSGKFIKADGTVVAIQDRLDNLTSIETSALYQNTFQNGMYGSEFEVDLLVSYDDETLDTELILEFKAQDPVQANAYNLVTSINPRTGVMGWIKVSRGNSITSIGCLDGEFVVNQITQTTSYNFGLYKNATNKQDTSRFAYIWSDRELEPGISFWNCKVLDIALFNNEPYLIMQTNESGMYAVPHDLINARSQVDGIRLLTDFPLGRPRIIRYRSNYLIFDDGSSFYRVLCPFKSIPNGETYETTEDTVITDYGYKALDSNSEFVTTPWELNADTDYTVLCDQRVDTDIKYVVCNGRLIPHID